MLTSYKNVFRLLFQKFSSLPNAKQTVSFEMHFHKTVTRTRQQRTKGRWPIFNLTLVICINIIIDTIHFVFIVGTVYYSNQVFKKRESFICVHTNGAWQDAINIVSFGIRFECKSISLNTRVVRRIFHSLFVRLKCWYR